MKDSINRQLIITVYNHSDQLTHTTLSVTSDQIDELIQPAKTTPSSTLLVIALTLPPKYSLHLSFTHLSTFKQEN